MTDDLERYRDAYHRLWHRYQGMRRLLREQMVRLEEGAPLPSPAELEHRGCK